MSLFDEWFKPMPIKEIDKSVCSMAFNAGLEAAAQYLDSIPKNKRCRSSDGIRALKEKT